MTEETPFDADESEIAERRPTNCPFCGHDGGFDAHGRRTDRRALVHNGQDTHFEVTWHGVRCPECNGRFQMLEESEEIDA